MEKTHTPEHNAITKEKFTAFENARIELGHATLQEYAAETGLYQGNLVFIIKNYENLREQYLGPEPKGEA